MGVRVELIGSNDKLLEAASLYGLKPGTGPSGARYVVLLLATQEGSDAAIEVLNQPHVEGGAVMVLQGSGALGGALDVIAEARDKGRRVALLVATREGLVEDWMADALRGLRAGASVRDMTVLLYGFTEEEASRYAIEDTRFYEPSDAADTVREALGYGGLYIGTYLAEYYPVEGLDEDLLSRGLGGYLAVRSVLEASGANAVVLNCGLFRGEGVEPGLALHLLLDEGVPAVCGGMEEMLGPIMLSLSLTGKPPAIGRVADYGDGLMLEPLLVPTLVAGERGLEPSGLGYTPRNRVKPGRYTLVSPGGGQVFHRIVEARHGGDYITVGAVEPWLLPSSRIALIPGEVGGPLAWSLYFLGLAGASPPIPLSQLD
ncbi:MAG: hypothetical protein GSR84_02885 [Desulfurococcales archaeon]|nr:hypothetical protein [Desulfurococcales archaeon]